MKLLIKNGVVKDDTAELIIPKSKKSFDFRIDEIIFSDFVEYISDFACYNMQYLKKVEFPANLKAIGKNSFAYCTALKNLSIPTSKIPIRAFYKCTDLENVFFSQKLTSIEQEAFAFCDSLTKIILPQSLNSLGKQAFTHCKNLEEVNINAKYLSYYDSNAFSYCPKLKRINLWGRVSNTNVPFIRKYKNKINFCYKYA